MMVLVTRLKYIATILSPLLLVYASLSVLETVNFNTSMLNLILNQPLLFVRRSFKIGV